MTFHQPRGPALTVAWCPPLPMEAHWERHFLDAVGDFDDQGYMVEVVGLDDVSRAHLAVVAFPPAARGRQSVVDMISTLTSGGSGLPMRRLGLAACGRADVELSVEEFQEFVPTGMLCHPVRTVDPSALGWATKDWISLCISRARIRPTPRIGQHPSANLPSVIIVREEEEWEDLEDY